MILTDDEIRKAAEFAAEQMWPESGYVEWTEDDAVFHRKFIEACFEKLRGGVELPEAAGWMNKNGDVFSKKEAVGFNTSTMKPLCTVEAALQYGAAQRLAGREQAIEECAKEAERMTMYPGGRQEAPAHDSVWHAARAIRALAASPQEQT